MTDLKQRVDAFVIEVYALAKKHGQRTALIVSLDDETGQTHVASPLDDPRDVQQVVASVMRIVSQDADHLVALDPRCKHQGES